MLSWDGVNFFKEKVVLKLVFVFLMFFLFEGVKGLFDEKLFFIWFFLVLLLNVELNFVNDFVKNFFLEIVRVFLLLFVDVKGLEVFVNNLVLLVLVFIIWILEFFAFVFCYVFFICFKEGNLIEKFFWFWLFVGWLWFDSVVVVFILFVLLNVEVFFGWIFLVVWWMKELFLEFWLRVFDDLDEIELFFSIEMFVEDVMDIVFFIFDLFGIVLKIEGLKNVLFELLLWVGKGELGIDVCDIWLGFWI